MELECAFCWYRLSEVLRGKSYIGDDGINAGSLGKLVRAIWKPLDIDSYIVSRMTLISSLKTYVREFFDDMGELVIGSNQEDSIINIDDEDNVAPVKDTLIKTRLCKTN